MRIRQDSEREGDILDRHPGDVRANANSVAVVTGPCIELIGVTKVFRPPAVRQGLLGRCFDMFLGRAQGAVETRALEEIDLQVFPGERVAIWGPNGAGKSTLLKLISGISVPTRGQVRVVGRVAPLLQIGAGFSPELTGRENVMLSCTLHGLSGDEIERTLPSIFEFCELGDWLERPTRCYSQGMRARLGFAVSSHLEADIYLVDEGLVAGDLEYRKKCQLRVRELLSRGKTWLMASHHRGELGADCQRAIHLEEGRIRSDSRLRSASRAASQVKLAVTHPKSGSQWVAQVLKALEPEHYVPSTVKTARLEEPLVADGFYAPVYLPRERVEALLQDAGFEARTVFLLRDLRDTLVSHFFSLRYSHPVISENIRNRREHLEQLDSLEEGLLYLMDQALVGFARIQTSWWDSGVPRYRFEDLIDDPQGQFRRMAEDLGLACPAERLEQAVLDHSFQARSGRNPGDEDIGSHWRKGVAGDWRHYFTPRVARQFASRFGSVLVQTGYEVDDRWVDSL